MGHNCKSDVQKTEVGNADRELSRAFRDWFQINGADC